MDKNSLNRNKTYRLVKMETRSKELGNIKNGGGT